MEHYRAGIRTYSGSFCYDSIRIVFGRYRTARSVIVPRWTVTELQYLCSGDSMKLLVTLSACLLGYGEVGLWLKKQAAIPESLVTLEGNRYLTWINDYSGEDYQMAVKAGIGDVIYLFVGWRNITNCHLCCRSNRRPSRSRSTIRCSIRRVEASVGAMHVTWERVLGYGPGYEIVINDPFSGLIARSHHFFLSDLKSGLHGIGLGLFVTVDNYGCFKFGSSKVSTITEYFISNKPWQIDS